MHLLLPHSKSRVMPTQMVLCPQGCVVRPLKVCVSEASGLGAGTQLPELSPQTSLKFWGALTASRLWSGAP